MRHAESADQIAVVQWWDHACRRYGLDSRDLYAVPNGGSRRRVEAKIMKAEGVRAGQPDLNLDVPRGRYHGLRIEMKRADRPGAPRGRVQKSQRERIDLYQARGYAAIVCRGFHAAREAIEAYLAGKDVDGEVTT